jgi:hypothetical protein
MKMANMKSKVCTLANSFIREGMNRSAAFVKAWALAKIEKIDAQLFSLNMIDRQSRTEKEYVRKLQDDRAALNAKANPVVKMIENPALSFSEKMSINARLTEIFMSRNPDWNEYKALEAKLYTAA